MKPRHLAVWTALVLILALAIGGAWRASLTADKHREVLAEAEQSRARLHAELDRLRQSTAARPIPAEPGSTTPHPSPMAPAGTPPPKPPPPASASGARSYASPLRGLSQQTILPRITDPKLQALRLEADRASLATAYGVFFTAQGLDAGQRKRFLDLIVERDAALHDLALIGETQTLAYNDPALAKNRQKLTSELRAAQADLLGEEGVAALRAYDQTVSLRAWVNSLAGTLAFTDSPLTPAQGEALVRALAQGQPRFRANGPTGLNEVDWAAFEAAAPAILTPAQLPMLHADIEHDATDRFTYQAHLLLREALQKWAAANASGKD